MSVGGISGKYTTRPSSSFVKVIHSPNLEFGVNISSSMTSSRVCSALKGSGTLSTHSGLMSTWECELCGPSVQIFCPNITLLHRARCAHVGVHVHWKLVHSRHIQQSRSHASRYASTITARIHKGHVYSHVRYRGRGSRAHHPSLNQRSRCD